VIRVPKVIGTGEAGEKSYILNGIYRGCPTAREFQPKIRATTRGFA
jgi:hypothetical protein